MCLDIKLELKALAMIFYNSKIEYNFGDGSYFPNIGCDGATSYACKHHGILETFIFVSLGVNGALHFLSIDRWDLFGHGLNQQRARVWWWCHPQGCSKILRSIKTNMHTHLPLGAIKRNGSFKAWAYPKP